MAETTLTVMGLPIFYKQRDSLFYPAWAYALPVWVLRIPISFMESALWAIFTYYTVGFAPAVSRLRREGSVKDHEIILALKLQRSLAMPIFTMYMGTMKLFVDD